MLNDLELDQEINSGSRDVRQREENKDSPDLLPLVLQLFSEVLSNVDGEVDVGRGEAH